ncbi:MAG: fibronectin type III domain-containing protein [Nitrospirota bacterium]
MDHRSQISNRTSMTSSCAGIIGWAFAALLLVTGPAFGADALLSWNPNTEADLAGYSVHYGASSGVYTVVIPVGRTTSYTVTGLGPGTYYFAVTAENTSGGDSGYSNEVSKTIADTVPPTISAVVANGITATGATITWTTNEAATTAAEYGTTTSYGASTAIDSTLVTAHTRTLSGLTPATTYHFRVVSLDATGNVAVSADYMLTTAAAADTTAPTLSSIAAGSVTGTGAVITWTTNEAASTQVEYGPTTAYGASTAFNATLLTAHSAALSGLQAATTYNYRVRSTDAAGNTAVSGNQTFTTVAAPDTTAPVISGTTASTTGATSAVITWTTNEASTSIVEYGSTTAYGSSSTNATLVTSHSLTLTGLAASTVYHYRVRSTDAAGNTASSSDFSFTTSAAPDTTAPTLSSIAAGSVTGTGAVITWTTNEAASTQVEYGPTTAYDASTALNATLLTAHSAALSGLQAATTYNYRVRSTDAAGNTAVSGNRTFTTAAAPDTTGPSIFNVATTDVTPTSAVVTWTTNEPATSQVEYGATTSYGQRSVANATLLTTHRETLSGLSPGTSYHLRVRSADAAGNLSVSGDRVVVIPSAPDTTPPQDVQNFSGVGAPAQIRLTWTNPPDADFSGVQIRFRTDRYPSGPSDGTLLGDFSGNPGESGQAVHDGVINGMTYYYSAASYDRSGNRQSTMYTSATPGATDNPSAETAQTGGCGMIIPSGGDPPGPWQAADLLILAGVALYLMTRRPVPRSRLVMPRHWGFTSSGAFAVACSGWWAAGPALSADTAGGTVRWAAV